MAKLKLGTIPDDRPIKLSIELPAAIHRELLSYAEIHAAQTGQAIAPEKLVPHMLTRFIIDASHTHLLGDHSRTHLRVPFGRLRA